MTNNHYVKGMGYLCRKKIHIIIYENHGRERYDERDAAPRAGGDV